MKKELSENIEEYLEVLYRNGSNGEKVSTTTISKNLGIAPGSVTQMLKKLESLGYIEYIPYKGAILTTEGMKLAQKITRKHRILEKFLSEVLNINPENIHKQACEMEHSLSDEAERALCHLLQHPDLCPTDNIIPACDLDFKNCDECDSTHNFEDIDNRNVTLLSLTELNENANGEVFFIRGRNDSISKVHELGIDIGTDLTSKTSNTSRSSTIRVLKDDSDEIKIPLELAHNIFIKVVD
ncbi:iron dependent repressor, metal binding and dimerization domain protein [Methanobrevibacter sp. DSM 116169]|uniref:metal-dependent transcriptional regulator n=1 Tax=Methanobrevibacter sp. DSM 116169 TaxID=3242727 RepID=UPI0038FC9A31